MNAGAISATLERELKRFPKRGFLTRLDDPDEQEDVIARALEHYADILKDHSIPSSPAERKQWIKDAYSRAKQTYWHARDGGEAKSSGMPSRDRRRVLMRARRIAQSALQDVYNETSAIGPELRSALKVAAQRALSEIAAELRGKLLHERDTVAVGEDGDETSAVSDAADSPDANRVVPSDPVITAALTEALSNPELKDKIDELLERADELSELHGAERRKERARLKAEGRRLKSQDPEAIEATLIVGGLRDPAPELIARGIGDGNSVAGAHDSNQHSGLSLIDREIAAYGRGKQPSGKTCCESRCWQCSYFAGLKRPPDYKAPEYVDPDVLAAIQRIDDRKAEIAADAERRQMEITLTAETSPREFAEKQARTHDDVMQRARTTAPVAAAAAALPASCAARPARRCTARTRPLRTPRPMAPAPLAASAACST